MTSNAINMLDIDLDAFLGKVVHFISGKRRLSGKEYVPWSEQDLRAYLENKLMLSKADRIPGRFAKEHDAALAHWRALNIQSGCQLNVCHIDGHADLGLGDASWVQITTEHLHLPVNNRSNPPIGHRGCNSGSYLAYAVAERLACSVQYVYPPGGGNDLPSIYFRNTTVESGFLQLKAFSVDDIKRIDHESPYEHIAKSLEPCVPFTRVPIAQHALDRRFDAAFVCQSPGFTPRSADRLLRVIADYVDFDQSSEPLP